MLEQKLPQTRDWDEVPMSLNTTALLQPIPPSETSKATGVKQTLPTHFLEERRKKNPKRPANHLRESKDLKYIHIFKKNQTIGFDCSQKNKVSDLSLQRQGNSEIILTLVLLIPTVLDCYNPHRPPKVRETSRKMFNSKGYVKNKPKAGYVVEMKCIASIKSVVYVIPELQQLHSSGYNLQISTR